MASCPLRAAALAVVAFGAACAAFPGRQEARGPSRAAAPIPRPPAPIAEPPEPVTGTGSAEPAAPPLAVDRKDDRPAREVLAEVDAWLLELRRLHGPDAQRRASDLLADFATLARRLGAGAAAERAREIEEDARALAVDPGWFGRTDRARGGLLGTVAALERIAERRGPELRPWIAAARAAAAAIRPENPFGLERTAIQDAYRAVADAFRAAIHLERAQRS